MSNAKHNNQGLSYNGVDLAQFDDDFEQTEVQEDSYDPIPDGKYQVNVEQVELTTARTSGNPLLKWTLRILAPRYRGRLMWRNNVIATRDNLKWLKKDLYTCGLELTKLSELPARLGQLVDVKLEVSKRSRGESENIYFNQRIVLDEGGGSYDAAAQDALIPF